MARYLALFGVVLLSSWINGCLPKKVEDRRSAVTGAVKDTAFLPGDPKIASFAWTKAELAECFSGRSGMQVYVWALQKTMRCDSATLTWK